MLVGLHLLQILRSQQTESGSGSEEKRLSGLMELRDLLVGCFVERRSDLRLDVQ